MQEMVTFRPKRRPQKPAKGGGLQVSQPDMKLVKVAWLDSRGCHDHWAVLEDLREAKPCIIWSVGWVIAETDDYIQICPHIGTDPDQGCVDMVVPKIAIQEIEEDNSPLRVAAE